MNDLDAAAPPADASTPDASAPAALHLFGIRHHGPGCARSLVRALEQIRPDCVLIEGPPEADALLATVLDEAMTPPVALLGYCPDEPRLAVYHPFAVFSPEWQALRWAAANGATARFIDLPLVHELAFEKAEREAAGAAAAPGDDKGANEAGSADDPAGAPDTSPAVAEAPPPETGAEPFERGDPLSWLARAAGYADGEAWWNHMVEERADGTELFDAIATAMRSLREEIGSGQESDEHARRDELREAHMR